MNCPECYGCGDIDDEECAYCEGTGEVCADCHMPLDSCCCLDDESVANGD